MSSYKAVAFSVHKRCLFKSVRCTSSINGHAMAIEKNTEAIADLIQHWIDGHVR
jgi:hypothetical protein